MFLSLSASPAVSCCKSAYRRDALCAVSSSAGSEVPLQLVFLVKGCCTLEQTVSICSLTTAANLESAEQKYHKPGKIHYMAELSCASVSSVSVENICRLNLHSHCLCSVVVLVLILTRASFW